MLFAATQHKLSMEEFIVTRDLTRGMSQILLKHSFRFFPKNTMKLYSPDGGPNKALQPTPSRFAGWGCSDPLLAAHLRVGSIARSGWLSLTFGPIPIDCDIRTEQQTAFQFAFVRVAYAHSPHKQIGPRMRKSS